MERPASTSGAPRRITAGLFWLFASLAIMLASVTFWAHQTLLTSEGWGGIVADLASDPEVIESTSIVIVDRLSERLDIEGRIDTILPGGLGFVAGAIAGNVEERLAGVVADFAARPEVQDVFVRVNEVGHEAAMSVIRDPESEALTSADGSITLNVFPLIEGALVGLQEVGLLDSQREIPDLSEYAPPAETVARLEGLLGRDLPEDIGTITLVESERLDRVQTAVRAFDLLTIGLVLLAAVCVAVALWLSARRVRMVLWLAIGAVFALLLGRGFTRLVIEDITGSLREGPAGETVRAVIESSVDSLMLFTFSVIGIGVVIAALAFWTERQAVAAVSGVTPRSARSWLREHARSIGWAGLGVIGFVVLWDAAGPDLALLAAAAVGIWLIVMRALASDEPTQEMAPVGPPATTPEPPRVAPEPVPTPEAAPTPEPAP